MSRFLRTVGNLFLLTWALTFSATMFCGMMFVVKWADANVLPTAPPQALPDPWDFLPSMQWFGHAATNLSVATVTALVLGFGLSFLGDCLASRR